MKAISRFALLLATSATFGVPGGGGGGATYVTPTPFYSAAGSAAQSTSVPTPTLPTHSEGDLLLMVVQTANQSISTPSGWTASSIGLLGTGTPGDSAAVGLQVFYKRAGASESAPSIDDSGDHTYVRIWAIGGVIKTGDPIGNSATGTEATAVSSFTWPDVTVQTANNAVAFIGAHNVSNTSTQRFDQPSNSNLENMTSMPGVGGTTGAGGGMSGYLGLAPASGAIGTTTGGNQTSTICVFAVVEILGDTNGDCPYVIADSGLSRTSGTPNPTLPSATATDDIILLFYQDQNDGAPATPTGWTAKANDNINGVGLYLFWRRADGTANDNPTLNDSGTYNAARLLVIRGCVKSGDPFDFVATNTVGSGAATFPGGTTTDDGCLIIDYVANDTDSADAGTTSYSAHSNMIEGRYMPYLSAGWVSFGGGGCGGGAAVLPEAGATGQSTCTFGAGGSSKVVMTMALKPEL